LDDGTITSDWYGCQDECTANGACVGFTYKYHPIDEWNPKNCYKKSAPWGVYPENWNKDTGVISGNPKGRGGMITCYDPGNSVNNADSMKGGDAMNANPGKWQECQQLCVDSNGCQSFTYRYHEKLCYSKGFPNTNYMEYNDDAISGGT